eukprot:jgi/Psemu1/327032/estExt_fgenesh1_pg.C_5240001
MWMDDNFRLEEWLAYHYYTMKLRYVVVNIDPWSKTSPDVILDRWRDPDKNLNMTIVVTNDREYMGLFNRSKRTIDKLRKEFEADPESQQKLTDYGFAQTKYHRRRQPLFYRYCAMHLVKQNRSWTSFHDTDEFVTFRTANATFMAPGTKQLKKSPPRHKLKKLLSRDPTPQQLQRMPPQQRTQLLQREEGQPPFRFPELPPGYLWNQLRDIQRRFPPDVYTNETAETVLCERIESNDGTDIDEALSVVPDAFVRMHERQQQNSTTNTNTSTSTSASSIVARFDTLRFRYLSPGIDGKPKSFIDLAQRSTQLYLTNKYLEDTKARYNTHLPLSGICVGEQVDRDPELTAAIETDLALEIDHYLGSWESYSARDDARNGGDRNYMAWSERANITDGERSWLGNWMAGFAKQVGPDVAAYLLQDAGRFDDNNAAVAENNQVHQKKLYQKAYLRVEEKKRRRGEKSKHSKKGKGTKKEGRVIRLDLCSGSRAKDVIVCNEQQPNRTEMKHL